MPTVGQVALLESQASVTISWLFEIGSSGRCEWTCFAELREAGDFFKMKITQYG